VRIPALSAQRRSARGRQPKRFLLEILLCTIYLVSDEKFLETTKNPPTLVPAEKAPKTPTHPPPAKKNKKKKKTRKLEKQQPYDKLVKFRIWMGVTDITRKMRLNAIPDFLQKVLPEPASPRIETVVKKKKKQLPPLPWRNFGVGTQTDPVAKTSASAVY